MIEKINMFDAFKVIFCKLQRNSLRNACRNGHIEIVKDLVENGAYVNAKDEDGVHKTKILLIKQFLNMLQIYSATVIYYLKEKKRKRVAERLFLTGVKCGSLQLRTYMLKFKRICL